MAAVGQRMPRWVAEAWDKYLRRMPPSLTVELREIPLSHRARNTDIARAVRDEGTALLAAIPGNSRTIALDVRGRAWSTEELARQLESWMLDGRDICLLVGGPEGLSDECRRRAESSWSLGPLTLPHPLVRVILAEQLYRAWTITANHPYHRA